MFSKLVAICAVVAAASAGLLPEPQYSHGAAVSSQSIVRHDQQQQYQHAIAAPVAYQAASAPTHYSSAAAVSSQNIVHHDQHQQAPVHYAVAPAHYAATPVHYAATPVHYATPVAKVIAPVSKLLVSAHHENEEVAYPKYEYTYSVADGHTGDNKSQQEVRDGDVVKGSYSFHEADGSIRTVEYTADDHSGFNAVVHNTAPAHAPVVKAAPVILKAAPVYYHH